MEGSAGDRLAEEVLLKNQTLSDVRFTVEVLDMVEGVGSSTAPEFVAIGDARRGAGAWIDRPRPDTFTIEAGTERPVPLVIDIPDDAGPGGWYAALVFVAEDPDPAANVPIDQQFFVPVLVTVDGDFERDLQLRISPEDRWAWRGGPKAWEVEMRNDGDVHEVLAGRVRIDGLLGGASSRLLRPAILLPGEVRRQRVRFDLRDAPDLIGATVRVERDEGEPRSASAARMVVLPWWLLLLLALGVLMVAWRLRTRSRSRDASPDPEHEDGSRDPYGSAR